MCIEIQSGTAVWRCKQFERARSSEAAHIVYGQVDDDSRSERIGPRHAFNRVLRARLRIDAIRQDRRRIVDEQIEIVVVAGSTPWVIPLQVSN